MPLARPLLLYCLAAAVLPTRLTPVGSSREKRDEEDLWAALRVVLNTEEARNVIVFIGDGMGPNTVTAARIYRDGEESHLAWEKFPNIAAIKTYSSDKQVPDSASTATAMFTGVKNNFEMLGLDDNVKMYDCEESLKLEHRLTSLATLAQDAGKSTGIVTTTRVTDATPAALYSWSAHRNWECDSALPENAKSCKDIARQLVEDVPGKYFNVILGGGDQVLRTEVLSSSENPIDTNCCRRTDGQDLVRHWAEEKASKRLHYATVNDTKSLLAVDTARTDYLFGITVTRFYMTGIFSNSHMAYEYKRNTTEDGAPSLELMTVTAVNLLAKYPNGFFLMVEGGMIDKGHHAGKARVALHEVLSLHDAVNATMSLLERMGLKEETLVIVTSDHSHTLTMSGYPNKGNNIFGLADKSLVDGTPYTTLSYATSGLENFHFAADGSKVVRLDPSLVDTTSFEYHVISPVATDMNTHGGSDVFLYATGPYSHLFHNIHENTYIATVIQYAARIGKFTSDHSRSSSPSMLLSSNLKCFLLFMVFIISYNFTN